VLLRPRGGCQACGGEFPYASFPPRVCGAHQVAGIALHLRIDFDSSADCNSPSRKGKVFLCSQYMVRR